ncbi:MAG: alanine--tRNA ligase [Spirochaetia bacterium]|nr:alanine--tRNA ligase [Spirochaetia bacterium]
MGKVKNKKITENSTKEWTVSSLRTAWLEYFKKQNHFHMPSASLIPAGDPTLLFTTAGMVQFKPYFAGTEEPPSRRVVTIQKCLRTTDLESVGKTERHCTFFEMLGNFSFGDYFKEEAIRFSWEFSLEYLKFNPEQIYVTVYEDDPEAEEIWLKKIGIPKERITHLGKEHNWWGPAGDSGACGPCSELYLDRGEQRCTCKDKASCAPGSECDRFMEYWNLVFNQFHQDTSGTLHPLPLKGIDTGAGLERIVALLNERDSVYDTDEMQKIISFIESLVQDLRSDSVSIAYNAETAAPFRVLTDHARAACFAIGDGIFPDNTGRGYVIRRIIRRALLFARELGIYQPVLYRTIPLISEIYAPFYPVLKEKYKDIQNRIRLEEERFLHTLDQGLKIWEEYLQSHKEKKKNLFGGEEAFKLYDTYGFPLEMTVELAEKEGLTVDLKKFQELMNRQREAASLASSFRDIQLPANLPSETKKETVFLGYNSLEGESKVIAVVADDKSCSRIKAPSKGMLILDESNFYPEGGGQLGDEGRILKEGTTFLVKDTQKKSGLIVHIGELIEGEIEIHDSVQCKVDAEKRQNLTKHHSATHLLNASLRKILGDHIMQTGSLVSPDYLRFDFSHPQKINETTIQKIEEGVIHSIEERAAVKFEVMPIDRARGTGAVAAFGEKYGETVRVVSMGTQGALSIEFCGGCHVENTGEIEFFHILKEGSPGAGNRRIEAVAGRNVIRHFQDEFERAAAKIEDHNLKAAKLAEDFKDKEALKLKLSEKIPDHTALDELFRSGPGVSLRLSEQIESIKIRIQKAEKLLVKFQKSSEESQAGELLSSVDDLLSDAVSAGPVETVVQMFENKDVQSLRKLGDALKEKKRNLVVLFGNTSEKGPVLIFMANAGAVAAGVNCGKMIGEAALLIGGRGGGRPDMAQAGGNNPAGLKDALDKAKIILSEL